jgi:Raf kinase inhibitor-like YbhB/YbcL family protein
MIKAKFRAHAMRVSKIALAICLSSTVARAFELSSPDMKPGEPLAEKFTFNGMSCKGGNVSPALTWSNPPEGTKSYALMVHDPDAPTGGAGIWHWVVINIPATTMSLPTGASTADGANMPAGSRQIANDYFGMTGNAAWGGPCPPKGKPPHHYNFTIYALKTEKLQLPPTATASQVGFFVNMNTIDKALLSIPYGRPE